MIVKSVRAVSEVAYGLRADSGRVGHTSAEYRDAAECGRDGPTPSAAARRGAHYTADGGARSRPPRQLQRLARRGRSQGRHSAPTRLLSIRTERKYPSIFIEYNSSSSFFIMSVYLYIICILFVCL